MVCCNVIDEHREKNITMPWLRNTCHTGFVLVSYDYSNMHRRHILYYVAVAAALIGNSGALIGRAACMYMHAHETV